MRVQTKIALLFAAFAASIILLISGFAYYFVSRSAFSDFYKRLDIRAVIAAKAALEKDESGVTAYNEIREKHLERLPGEREYFIREDSVAAFTARNAGTGITPAFCRDIIQNGSSSFRKGQRFYTGIHYPDNEGNYIVIVSAHNDFSSQYLNQLRNTLIACIAGALLISVLTGLFFSKKILEPVRKIAGEVRNISARNLHMRLSAPQGKDEIALLADTFNNMLDRLETAFETQNNFVSNASHELNTPLTNIIGEAELVLSRPRETEQYKASLEQILNEAEKLRSITRSLLYLAQTGFNGKVQNMTPIRCDELLYSVKKTVEGIIPNSQICFDHSLLPEDAGRLVVYGNNQLLELAFTNIVLNACKYSSNKPVYILLAATDKKVIVIVRDQGIGIPSREVQYVFEPFFRASNTGDFAGYGIGLPLARNIFRMHQGDITVRSEQDLGAEIKVELPAAHTGA